MPQFELLGSLMRDLHQEFVRLYYLMLPLFFAIAIASAWFRAPGGGLEFVDTLRRTIVATLLLAALPDISRAIIVVADGIADKIDQMNNIDVIIRMAQEKSQGYSLSLKSILLQFDDLIIAGLSFISYLVLYIARYLTLAMYHFFWLFYMVTAPLLLLFNLFPGTSQITKNLFRGMIEVASWKIVWAILGAMLASLSFGEMYRSEGSYVELIVMNFVIAIAMLATPMLVRSLINGGLTSMSSVIGPASVAAIVATPARAATMYGATKGGLSSGKNFVSARLEKRRSEK
ncbi:MAG: hypothetical protein SGJ18_02220 [Pseudomonadota bacterium]|nr:hypothetical protein [Pseudomonadota bacterium]